MFVGPLATPLEIVQQEQSATRKSATGEECKTKTSQRVKVQLEIVQNKSAARKKVQHENGAK